MAEYIDVHSHIYDPLFDSDIVQVVESAVQAGVRQCVVVSENSQDCEKILSLVNRFPKFCAAGFGVHPVQGDGQTARSVCQQDLDELMPYIDKYASQLVCIGEVGLDFSPQFCVAEDSKTSQRQVLENMVRVSERLDLPLNVHSRSAGRPTIALLKSSGAKNVVMHAFDGKPSVALEGVQCGFYFSVPPCIVRSEQKVRLVKAIPLDHLLLETDSPALGPDKTQRNEPRNVKISCQQIAQIKGVPEDQVVEITLNNSLKLFSKLHSTDVTH